MSSEQAAVAGEIPRLQRPIDRARDNIRGGSAASGVVSVVVYSDYLCPYCRRLRHVLDRLRQALGERMAYVFRHYPNERAHPGAGFIHRAAEAAGRQGRFWEMHDWIYAQEPPPSPDEVRVFVRSLDIDMDLFEQDLEDDETRRHVEGDLAEGKRNGVTGTPTVFIDGLRY